MKKLMKTALVAGVLLGAWAPEIQAQSLKDILNSKTVQNAVTAVTGGQKMSMDNLVGTWTYSQPSVQLEGDNVLKDITGSVAATEAEKKLQEYCSKVGIEEGMFNYTFQADSTFTSQLKKGSLKGAYTFDAEAKTITFTYSLLGGKSKWSGSQKFNQLTARVVMQGNEMSLLFDADKLLKFLSTVATLTNSSSLKAITKLANEYEGMLLGFELKK